ncbi:MAG: hypothetical protein RRE21_04995 [Desulfurococcales archaeon]|nr:hypothetical protein [Desulfurococcales archaeon]
MLQRILGWKLESVDVKEVLQVTLFLRRALKYLVPRVSIAY